MKLTQASKRDIEGKQEVKHTIEDFLAMNTKYADVEWKGSFPSVQTASSAFKRTARKEGNPVTALVRGEKLFLENTGVEE